jgi:capsular exopolysaccharide synthesis family protein
MNDSRYEQNRISGPGGGRLVSASAGTSSVAQGNGYGSSALGIDPARAIGSSEDMRQKMYDYLRVVIKRKWLIAAIMVATGILGAVHTLMQTPLYASTARLQIDRDMMQVVKGGDVNPVESGSIEFLRTQYELLQGRAMAERVTDALRLGDDPEFLRPRDFSLRAMFQKRSEPGSDTAARAASQRSAATIVLANRSIRPIPGSRLVDITFTDPSPQRAQRIANAYAEAFIASNLDKRFEANSYAKTFLDDQIKQLKLRLEESEKALLDFAEREQIVQITEKSSIAENNLASANAALGLLISERIKNEQLWSQVERSTAINLPQLLTNSVIDNLRGRRNALVTEYQEKLETFKPSYPLMVQIDQKIKEIDRQLATEVKTIKASLKAGYESSKSQEEEMTARIATLKSEVLELQKRMIRYNILKREVDTNRELYNGLLQRFKEVDVAGGVGANNVFIVDKAMAASSPSSPILSRALLLALMLGLAGGLGTAYFLERLDDRVHSPDEIERISGLPILGIIPHIGAGTNVEREIADPRSALSEAYRSLCTALQFSTERGLPKTIVVTSSSQGEGKSITALGIARHFATIGLKVLLIDADLRLPSMHIKLGLDNSIGLSNYLTGACMPPEAMQSTPVPNLAFMASGPLPPNAADLLSGTRMHSLLSVGLEVFDLVVIDGPPMLGLADSQLLSNAAEATVFVVAAHQARAGQVRGALRRLQLARTPVIGAVMTKFDSKTAGYGYGYGHAYGYGYGQNPYSYGGQVQSSETPRPELTAPTGHG